MCPGYAARYIIPIIRLHYFHIRLQNTHLADKRFKTDRLAHIDAIQVSLHILRRDKWYCNRSSSSRKHGQKESSVNSHSQIAGYSINMLFK